MIDKKSNGANLGLIFLKYISDAFQTKYDELATTAKMEYTDPEDRDEYAAANIFWVRRKRVWKKSRLKRSNRPSARPSTTR